ncbi:glycosyltransferase [Psychromonas arctica]|uniref:glycosyltransferase n=1 Tax=Psychromonas arctica TaxID=168275 RepID=UPI0012EBB77E|nr:glycosyltransferase [Psychromonas arctica]
MQKKVNIVHYWGGSPVFMTSKWLSYLMLIKKCHENGWTNWLVLSKKPDDASLVQPFIEAGCKIVYQPRSKGNFDLASIYRNYKLLKKVKCDVFHCYNDHTSPLIAAKLANVKIRIWSKLAMSSYYEKGTIPRGLQRLMLSTWITCLISNRILAIADIAGKELSEQVGFKNKIVTVYTPVSLARFIYADRTGVRNRLELEASDIVITTVGHCVPVKGWDIAIEAFAKVCKKIPQAKLLFVGAKKSSLYSQELFTKITEYNLGNKVIFTGIRHDIPEILSASDLFILPSRSEGMPAALIEAMATGLPCVATRSGGISEVIEHGQNGLLFDRENADDLAEKIISIMLNPDLNSQFSQMAKQDLQKYEISTYVNIVINHYEDLLGNTPKK